MIERIRSSLHRERKKDVQSLLRKKEVHDGRFTDFLKEEEEEMTQLRRWRRGSYWRARHLSFSLNVAGGSHSNEANINAKDKCSSTISLFSWRSSLTILVECRRCNDIIDDHVIAFKRALIKTRRDLRWTDRRVSLTWLCLQRTNSSEMNLAME